MTNREVMTVRKIKHALAWLNFGESFGVKEPIVLNFGILVITFGLTIRITMASIIGVAVAIIAYRLL